MTKILITGKNSFVGRNLYKYSVYKDVDEVSLFERRPDEVSFNIYDVVIHLVAIVHQTKKIPEKRYFEINTDLCIDTAIQAKQAGVKHFIFLSTVKVYGKFVMGHGPWTEESECYPDDSYGKSKYEAEKELLKMDSPSFRVSVVRTPLVYGEEVRANMLSIMKLVRFSYILPFKNLRNRRNFTSAENLVAFIDRIIEKRIPGVFIAMDEEAISTSELVKMIADYMNKKLLLFQLPDLLLGAGIKHFPRIFDRLYGSFEMDNTKTLEKLDFKPPVPISEGIRKMVKSFNQL